MVLESHKQEVVKSMIEQLGQRPFLRHLGQGFEQSAMVRAYGKEEGEYVKILKSVLRKTVPHDANIVSLHMVYKNKKEGDESLPLKARTEPHRNEY